MWLYFTRTKLGVAMAGLLAEPACRLLHGHPVKRVHSLIWALSGMTCGRWNRHPVRLQGFDRSVGSACSASGAFSRLPVHRRVRARCRARWLGGIIIGVIEPFAGRYIAVGLRANHCRICLLFLILVFRPHGILAQVHAKKV